MLNRQAIIEALRPVLHGATGVPVYVDRHPKNFERPSLLLQSVRGSHRDLNRSTLEETCYLTVTCYVELDAYDDSKARELMELQQRVRDVFRPGYLQIEDRAVKFGSSDGGMDFDRAWVDLQCSYAVPRKLTEEELPLMADIQTNTNLST